MRLRAVASIFAAALSVTGATLFASADGFNDQKSDNDHKLKHQERLKGFSHVVVIYQENHSFDNLYGQWGHVDEDAIDGLSDAPTSRTVQVRQGNQTAYKCLLQNDVNLTSPTPLPTTCTASTAPPCQSAFTH